MNQPREMVSWAEVTRLIDFLLQQLEGEYQTILMVTRGGVVPGGMLAEMMGIQSLLTVTLEFPPKPALPDAKSNPLLVFPRFIHFPDAAQLEGLRVLVVDAAWGSGRMLTAVRNRVTAEGGQPSTCVLHYNPQRSLFAGSYPDYYGARTTSYIIYPWEGDRGFRSRYLNHAR